jgi:shikimate dehydrogenase
MVRPSRLVLLGHPVAHSLSPRIQNAALRSAGIPLEYVALDVAPADLPATLDALIAEGAAGNVTIPHKEHVAARASLTPLAQRAGAVNTFWVEGPALHGDNTDVLGFDATVRALLGGPPRGSVAVLGAGGAAAAVLAAVEHWNGAVAVVHSRTPERVSTLCARFPGMSHPARSVGEALDHAVLVVNATPVGLRDDTHPIDLDRVPRAAAVIDLVYRIGGTSWSRAAVNRGHRACDGLPMLIEQAAAAFERWFGVRADREAMWRALD